MGECQATGQVVRGGGEMSEGPSRRLSEGREDADGEATARGQGIQVALAEFNALRSELDDHASAQNSLIALVVTAIGIVAGFVIKDHGDLRLLLILPVLVAAAGIHHAEQDRSINLI